MTRTVFTSHNFVPYDTCYLGGVVSNNNQYNTTYPQYGATSFAHKNARIVIKTDGCNSEHGYVIVRRTKK